MMVNCVIFTTQLMLQFFMMRVYLVFWMCVLLCINVIHPEWSEQFPIARFNVVWIYIFLWCISEFTENKIGYSFLDEWVGKVLYNLIILWIKLIIHVGFFCSNKYLLIKVSIFFLKETEKIILNKISQKNRKICEFFHQVFTYFNV